MLLDIVIPHPDQLGWFEHLLPHTAIVCHPEPRHGMLTLYYEGNVYSACNLQTFDEKLACAAGRLVHRYPTCAFMAVPPEAVIKVGSYDTEQRRIVEITNRPALMAYAGDTLQG